MQSADHVSVLLTPVLDALRPLGPSPRLIDGTLGAGGHSRALLDQHPNATLLGLDLDPQALALARATLAPYGNRAHIVQASYTHMVEQAAALGWDKVDGILLDLGVSSMQFDTPERGFSFRFDAPLDMRFNPQRTDHPTAADLLNTLDADALAKIFWEYGEEQFSRPLARAIIAARPLTTTRQLADVISAATPKHKAHGPIHPATRIFQALRIAVNDELGTVSAILPRALDLLHPAGRLAVISFHSLEDRLVKDAFKLAATDCICPPKLPACVCGHQATVQLITRKPLIADAAEQHANPRSRSAKLRVAERL